MKQTLTALTLIAVLTGCVEKPQEVDKIPIRAGMTVVEDGLYKATLTDIDGDGLNDALKIERKSPTSDGSIEPWVEYFVTSLPRTPSSPNGEVVNLVKPEFFAQYRALFTPNRDFITSTYKGQ